MSIYIQFPGTEPTFLASNKGWSEMIDWTETLKDTPELTKLCQTGYTDQAKKVLAELKDIKAPSEDIQHTCDELAYLLEGEEEGTITDGVVE